jgi:hypothetical protein
MARRAGPVPWTRLLWLGLFFLLGLYAVRNVLWWALAAPPVLAQVLDVRKGTANREAPSLLHTLIAAYLALAALVAFPWWGKSSTHPPENLLAFAPAGITAEVPRVLPVGGRMFNTQLWGSWFEFALPDRAVFIDSRIEIYSASVWRDYSAVSEGREGWQQILNRWRVSAVVVDRTRQANLIPLIRHDPGWRLDYQDRDGLIFVRA